MREARRDYREPTLPSGEGSAPTQERSLLSHCFQDGPAAEKESQILKIVSVGRKGGWGLGMGSGHGLRLHILLCVPQCSHVAGICHNILSYSPQELLKQRAVLERVQLEDPLVSPHL